MKRLFNLLLTAAIALSALAVSGQMYDDSELRDKISGLEGRVSSIESKIANPYIQFDYTAESIFYGAVEMPVHVELPNPWQENLATDFTVVLQGQ